MLKKELYDDVMAKAVPEDVLSRVSLSCIRLVKVVIIEDFTVRVADHG